LITEKRQKSPFGRGGFSDNTFRNYGSYRSRSEIENLLKEILSTDAGGLFQVLALSTERLKKYYRVNLSKLPRHAQIYLKSGQGNAYHKQLFEMLDMQENALEKDGKAEPCILLSQEEYFIVSLMSSLNEIGNTNDPSGGSFESNSLATILLNSVHDMILFLVASDSAKRKPFRNFMVKLFFFIEDFAINQILVEGMTSPELSLGQVVGGSSSHLPNFMMFRLYTSLIRGNQELYRSYYLKSRRYGRIGSSSYKGTIFTNFVYRTHEFCTNCMSKWRRDHRVSILELGEVIIYLLDPINVSTC